MATIAEQVAEIMGNDGQKWEDKDGWSLEARIAQHDFKTSSVRAVWNSETEKYDFQEHPLSAMTSDSRVRYEFTDGSAIVVSGDAWDIEGAEDEDEEIDSAWCCMACCAAGSPLQGHWLCNPRHDCGTEAHTGRTHGVLR